MRKIHPKDVVMAVVCHSSEEEGEQIVPVINMEKFEKLEVSSMLDIGHRLLDLLDKVAQRILEKEKEKEKENEPT